MSNTRIGAAALVLCGWALAALLAACRDTATQNARTGPDPGSETEDVAIQFTVWSARHELFVEHPPPVAGEPVIFAIHVTEIDTTKPRRDGPLALRFVAPDGTVLAHVEPAPARDGIYLPAIRFAAPGDWAMQIAIPHAAGTDELELSALRVFASEADGRRAEHPPEPEGIGFTKEQQWRLGTRIAPVRERALVQRAAFHATIEAAPGRRALLSPPVAGALVAAGADTALGLGRRVEAGELLAYLRPPLSDFGVRLVEARAEVERTRLALGFARAARERVALLHGEGARSQRELEEAEHALGAAEVEHTSAVAVDATLSRSGLVLREETLDGPALPLFELRAPIGGRVTRVDAAIGEHLSVDRVVVEILDASSVHVVALVTAEELARVDALGAPLLRWPRRAGAPERVEAIEARLVSAALEVDPATRAAPFVYEVPNQDGRMLVGQALELLLPVRAPERALALPLGAIVDEAGEALVYVQLAGETFERRYVELGASDGEWVQVLSGLAEGERAVTAGAYALRLASASGALPAHGHHH